MPRRFADHFLSALSLRHDASEITHGARRHEQSRFAAKDFRGSILQAIDGRIFEINIVADFRLRHRPAHSRRRLGHSVAAKVDNFIGACKVDFTRAFFEPLNFEP